MQVYLNDDQAKELKSYIFEIAKDGIDKARKDTGLDRPFLKQKYMASWLGLSVNSFKKLVDELNIPSTTVDGITLYDKEQVKKIIIENQTSN